METRHEHQLGAEQQRRIQNYVQAIDVIQRQTAQDAVRGIEFSRVRSQQLVEKGRAARVCCEADWIGGIEAETGLSRFANASAPVACIRVV